MRVLLVPAVACCLEHLIRFVSSKRSRTMSDAKGKATISNSSGSRMSSPAGTPTDGQGMAPVPVYAIQ